MKLYLIENTTNTGYDVYDSAVVVANSPAKARKILPGVSAATGCAPKDVKVSYIGEAGHRQKEGTVICTSFNAG